MTHVACRMKATFSCESSMHQCTENRVAIGRAVVLYAQAAHADSAGIEC